MSTSQLSSIQRLHLGQKLEISLLSGLIPNSVHEQVFDCDQYYAALVIYPNKCVILGFEAMYAKMKEKLKDLLLPVFFLVKEGIFGSFFVVYIRKENFLAAETVAAI